jgi:hypothetical protein
MSKSELDAVATSVDQLVGSTILGATNITRLAPSFNSSQLTVAIKPQP